jgi:hypothetical protein
VFYRSWILNSVLQWVAREVDETCSSADNIESDPEKHLVNGGAARVSGVVASAAWPGGDSNERLRDMDFSYRLVDREGEAQCA